MTKKEKFRDKFYIMQCDMPSELFTVKGIKKEFRELAKLWHPDVSDVKEALFIMSKINALYNEGMALIAANKFYEKERLIYRGKKNPHYQQKASEKEVKEETDSESVDYDKFHEEVRRSKKKKSIELITKEGKCARFKYLKRVMIELGYMYISETYVMLEITKLKRKIFMDSMNIIKKNDEGYFKIEVPEIVDTFETDTHGYIVLKKERGVEPIILLETVVGYLKPLGCRKICEGIFYDLTALKYMGLTSTGINKDLWFIDVNTGKLINYGLFFYLHEFNGQLSRAPKEISETLNHIKPKDNESVMIDVVKEAVLKLNLDYELKVDDFTQWLQQLTSNSLEKSLAESQVFNRSILSVTTHGFSLDHYYQAIS